MTDAVGSLPPDLDAVLSDRRRAAIVAQAPDIPAMRLRALRDSAIAYGVRSGMARRGAEIDAMIAAEATALDSIYNFNTLMLEQNVVPPVLTESNDSVKITDGSAIRLSDATYSIVMQAHFASGAPNWRDYLRPVSAYTVSSPDAALMPKTSGETDVWKRYVAEGWTVGKQQADAMFTQNLSRLKRDLSGMILYRRLLAQGMVSKPYVGRADLGVTGDGQSMAINDRILRITATPRLNTSPATWKAIAVPVATKAMP